jgi:UDP:flavonoid glycosyltransferase YjiC (YdhE family)
MKIGMQTWGSEGDCRPFVHLAAGLAAAGHEVRLAITEVGSRSYAFEAEAGGFELREVASPVFRSPEEQRLLGERLIKASNPLAQSKLLLEQAFDPVSDSLAEASGELAECSDVLVGHYFLPSVGAAAERRGIPHVTVQLTSGFVPGPGLNPFGNRSLGVWVNRLLWGVVSQMTNRLLLERTNPMRHRFGLRPVRDVMRDTWISPYGTLVAVSRVLCPEAPGWPSCCKLVGPLSAGAGHRPIPAVSDAMMDWDTPVVFFTFGSLMPTDPNAIHEVLEIWSNAARRAGVIALMQCDNSWEWRIPEHVHLVTACAHDEIFPRCAAVVHHGGAGTIHACIRAGVPSVVVPHVADQFFWGATVRRLRLGSATRKRRAVNADEIASHIRAVMANREVRLACEQARKIARSEDGVSRAVEVIENLPTCKNPPI